MIEQLESRRMFAVTAAYDGWGSLWIGPDNAEDDGLAFTVEVSSVNNNVIVTVNGTPYNGMVDPETNDLIPVSSVILQGTPGYDTLDFTVTTNNSIRFQADMGPGGDTMNAPDAVNCMLCLDGMQDSDTYNVKGRDVFLADTGVEDPNTGKDNDVYNLSMSDYKAKLRISDLAGENTIKMNGTDFTNQLDMIDSGDAVGLFEVDYFDTGSSLEMWVWWDEHDTYKANGDTEDNEKLIKITPTP